MQRSTRVRWRHAAAVGLATLSAPVAVRAQQLSGQPAATTPTQIGAPPPAPGQTVTVPGSPSPLPMTLPDPSTAQILTLSDAVAAARRNPPSVLAALARVPAAQAQVDLARAALLPSVSGSIGLAGSANNGSFISGGIAATTTTVQVFGEAAISARWTIWDFGRTDRNVAAALAGVRGVREDARAAERAAVAQAAAAYFVLLSDEELVASLQETVRQREQQATIARGLVESGARARIEQTRADVALDSARLDLTVADATTLNDAAVLSAALALDPVRRLHAAAPGEFRIDDDPERAANAAVAARPEIAAAVARVEQARAQLSAARGNYLPTLSAAASASVRYTDRLVPEPAFASPAEFANASVTLAVPIFDPVINAQIRAALANVAVQQAIVDQQVLAVRTEAVQAAIAVRSARQTQLQAERLAAGARANLEQAQGRYAAGAAPQLELVDAQAADATARVSAIRARLQYELAKVRLLVSLGRTNDLGQAR